MSNFLFKRSSHKVSVVLAGEVALVVDLVIERLVAAEAHEGIRNFP